jgi:CBS domain-containing protein
MENTIPRRIYDFLRAFPPFNLLDEDIMMRVSERVLVKYLKVEDTLFHQGEPPGQHIYVVKEGAVHLYREEKGEKIMVESCDEGDVFGIRPFISSGELLAYC